MNVKMKCGKCANVSSFPAETGRCRKGIRNANSRCKMGEEKPDRRGRRKRGRRRRQRARKGCEKDTQNAKIFMRNFLIRKIQAEKL